MRSEAPARAAAGLIGLAAIITATAQAKDEAFVTATVVAETPQATTMTFDFESPIYKNVRIGDEVWTTVHLGNESITACAGEPALPDVRRSVMIGDDATVQANFVTGTYRDITGVDVAPSKGIISRAVNPADVPYEFGDLYTADHFWPSTLVEAGEPYVMRNVRGVVIDMNPIQWNPTTGTLRVWSSMTVEVVQTGVTDHNILTQRDKLTHTDNASWETLYSHRFVNYGTERRYDPLDNTGDMLIICHDPWLANIQPLADHKNSIGINTTVVAVSAIGNSPASINSYIGNMYDSGDLCYVLLVGDAEHISAYTAADNGLSDPTYGKRTADDYPDLFVGRFCANSAADVDTQVERSIAYEADAWTERPEYLRAAGIASNQGPGDDNETDDVHVANIMAQLDDDGYTYTTVIADPSGSVAEGVAAINSGLGAIAYCGHGSTTCWGNGAPLCNSDVDGLTNTEMLPWIVSVACINGEFNAGTCFAEAWMQATHGGAPSGSIGIYASSINQSWAPPMCAEDETFDLFSAETYTTLGVLFYGGSCQMMDEYGSGGVDMYDTWHHFGDPSIVVVGTAAPPTGMRVTGSGFNAEGPNGGPFYPDMAEFTLTNHEEEPLDFTVSGGASWMNYAPNSGTIPVGGEIVVTASIDQVAASNLPNGLHEATLSFVNNTTHDGDVDKNVSINVGTPVAVMGWNMDTDPGWSVQAEWGFGMPTGGGGAYGNPDPTSGATGSNVYGVNLNGDYASTVGGPWHLMTSAIDCTDYTDTSFKFQRWLNSDYQPYVTASIEVSNNGSSWTMLWENGSSEIADSSWSEQVFDISSVADGQSSVYIRWSYAVADYAWNYSGWNIDDVEIWAVDGGDTQPCDGDINGDGVVNVNDILAIIADFGTLYDVNDILIALENFGSDC